jgi:hypothetical protein
MYSTRKRRCVPEPRLFSPATEKRRVPPMAGFSTAARLGRSHQQSGGDGNDLSALRRYSIAGPLSKSLTTTFAPCRASFNAIARPMPRPEPETSATLPARLLMNVP